MIRLETGSTASIITTVPAPSLSCPFKEAVLHGTSRFFFFLCAKRNFFEVSNYFKRGPLRKSTKSKGQARRKEGINRGKNWIHLDIDLVGSVQWRPLKKSS